jgi:hypothetical protein
MKRMDTLCQVLNELPFDIHFVECSFPFSYFPIIGFSVGRHQDNMYVLAVNVMQDNGFLTMYLETRV